jgi:general secretion pathway protein G
MSWNRSNANSLPGRQRLPRVSFLRRRAPLGRERRRNLNGSAGVTLLELVVACAILIILASISVPLARNTVKRAKEDQLRRDLRDMRDAIDRYKDASDKGLIQVKAGTEGYPVDLETLMKPTQLTGAADKRIRFLRSIPTDPMTGNKDWGMRSVQDDPDSTAWGGQDVFDVFTKSSGTALDGTKYSDW